MKYNIAEILNEMLKEVGANDLIESDLSNHSTISLNMKDDIPAIHLKCDTDEVWVWSQLGQYSESALNYCSANLLSLILEHDEEVFYLGQPALYLANGNLEIRAMVKENHLDSASSFMNMLDTFLTILVQYRNALH
ncbi:hypothetical protein O3W44_01000 [Pantoea sp. LMR881]|uniref:InvB/SpaK family type III secretion system chaperone n=1 Tax=Pantoea sp. LMR881 TaxID=3014336 RepID=UPI0022AFE2D7|nr:hypothetical protein [Pantoea sp. LMR881]MCZ4057961.1 hypothetical protein [Pantoea sp. LMR881]